MTFQQNVRSTFYWRTVNKKASVVALAITFFTSFAIASESNTIVAYLMLLNMAVLVAVVVYMTTDSPKVNLYGGTTWYRIADIWRPILLGLIIVLVSYVALFFVAGFPLAAGDPGQKFRDVLFWAVLVGFVEEFVRWTWLQTLPFSPLVANLVWVLLHPQVAVLLAGKTPNYFFMVFAFAFGLLATLIMWLYETPLAYGANRYLGPIMAATIHAGFNALVVIWKVQLVIPAVGETPFQPMFAPAVLAAGFLSVLSFWAITRRRAQRRRASASARAV